MSTPLDTKVTYEALSESMLDQIEDCIADYEFLIEQAMKYVMNPVWIQKAREVLDKHKGVI